MTRALVLACGLALAAVAPAAGQGAGTGGGTQAARDSTVRDTVPRGAVARDTVPRDSAARDSARASGLREQVLQKLRTLEESSRPRATRVDSAGGQVAGADTAAADAGGAATGAGGAAVVAELVADSVAGAAAAVGAAAPRSPFGAARYAGVLPASDSVVARLRALEGYVVTEYRAANARFDRESGKLDLVGEPQLARGAESMRADSLLSFDQRTSIVCGYGKPVLTGTGSDPVESDQVCYDVNRQVGVAMGARTKFSQQGTWYVHGTELYTSGTDRLYGSATGFTSCDLDEPHYHFSAGELKVVHESVMVARNVTLKFGDVPVFWLPFLIQSLKPDRRSGLLTPSLGLQHVVRTSSGYRREIRDIGFYWALSDHLGLTSAMDWQSGGYVALRGRLQYRWLRQFLGGDVSFSRYWKEEGGTDFTLSGNSNWQPGERTSLRASVNYSSSNDLVRRYSVDPEELNRSIDSNIGISHRFDWGNLNLSGNRRQHLSNDQVDLTLPTVSLTFNPVTLFEASADPRWYNNATWNGSATFNARQRQVNLDLPSEKGQNTTALQGSADSRLTLGKLNWSGRFSFSENVNQDRPTWYNAATPDSLPRDSVVYHRAIDQTMQWSTGLSYTQRLIENTHLSPSISLSGGMRMQTDLPDSLGVHGQVAEPVRLDMGASLRTNVFGFWPGVGPYSRIRHRLEPSLAYTYSPAPEVTDLQRRAFGTRYDDALRERNQVTLNLSQTFEAKPKEPEGGAEVVAEDTVSGPFGEVPPRRLRQAQPITLVAISSSAVMYDFVRAREGEYGFTTEQMTHGIRSDLVKGLSLSVGHDLFKKGADGDGERSFSPRLRTVSAQFSLNSESWPFRLFHRGGGAGEEELAQGRDASAADSVDFGDQGDIAGSIMPGQGRSSLYQMHGRNQAVGTWRSDFNYSLTRPPAGVEGEANQMLTASLSFQPTENWNVSWRTGYSFTLHEFSDHVLALTRDLHRWQAGFFFSRTQFGAFTFRFNVRLLDNPDIKVDYDQRSPVPPPQYR